MAHPGKKTMEVEVKIKETPTWYRLRYFWVYLITLGAMLAALLIGKLDGAVFATTIGALFGVLLGGGALKKKDKE